MDLPRSSYSTERTSNRFMTDNEGGAEEVWSDAQEKGPKIYNSFSSAAAAASRSSLSQRSSLPHLYASSPQAQVRPQSNADSPVFSSPLTPSSSNGALSGHRPKQSSLKRILGLGQEGGSPTASNGADGFSGPGTVPFSAGGMGLATKQASWSVQAALSPLASSRKNSDQSLTLADVVAPPRRDSAAVNGALQSRTSSALPRSSSSDASFELDESRESRLVGLGLGPATGGPTDISELEQGRGYGWNPERERSRTGSNRGKATLRGDSHDVISKKGSLAALGRPGIATSEIDLTRVSRNVSFGSQRMHSDLTRPLHDLVAMSVKQEQAIDSESSTALKTSAFAKLFRRKGKSSSEAKLASSAAADALQPPPPGRITSPAVRQIRRTASQNLLQQRAASIDVEAPLVVSPKVGPPMPPPTSPLPHAPAEPRRSTVNGRRPTRAEFDEDSPTDDFGPATPRAPTTGVVLAPDAASPSAPRSAATTAGPASKASETAAGPSGGSLRVDTTPVPGRSQASPSTPLSRSSVHRQTKQSSIDSSSSTRRRSLAFLASAITMGSIADQQGVGGGGEPEASHQSPFRSSFDMHQSSTAIGTVSPPPPPIEPLQKSQSQSTGLSPHVESGSKPVPIRALNRPKLVPKGATREDHISSVLTDFLKMDALGPGANGRAKGQKTAAAMYAEAYRSSSDEDGPDIRRPATRPHLSHTAASSSGRKGDGHPPPPVTAAQRGSGASAGRGSADDRNVAMSSLHQAESSKFTAGSSEAKKSTLSVSPKSTRTAVRGTFAAAPAGPSMGGYISPFYVAPLTSVDGGIAARSGRPSGRRASASSRSIASDESRSVKSGISGSTGAAAANRKATLAASKEGKSAFQDPETSTSTTAITAAAASQGTEAVARRAKSHTNLKAAQQQEQREAQEAEASGKASGTAAADRLPAREEAVSTPLQKRRPSLGIATSNKAMDPTAAVAPPPTASIATAATVTASPSRLRSASSSSTFGQRLFRRPRTAGGDLSAHPLPSLQTSRTSDVEPSQRAASYDLLASPTGSIEFEMLDTSAKTLEVARNAQRGNSISDFGRLSHEAPRPTYGLASGGGGAAKRDSRGRSNSIASIDVHAARARNGRASSDAYTEDRQSGDPMDRRGFSPSRLESSGGVASLFGGGGGTSRQRTSSLLPSFGFGRARTSSSAGLGSATPTNIRSGARSPDLAPDAGLPAHESGPQSFAAALASITTADSGSQNAVRRKGSFRALVSAAGRKASAPGPGASGDASKGRSNGASLQPEEYFPRTSRDSGEDGRSAGRLSISSTRRSSSLRTSFQRRPSSRTQGSATELDSPGSQPPPPPPQATASAKPSFKESAPWPDESAEEYAERIADTVPKTEIAAVLASSADPFYAAALRHHMTVFWFNGNALDIALRKLLMGLHLPKETQQIDRVMEAFAKRYNECNNGLFASEDQPYILSFSLMMLHTDAFNKNAKHKMTKADYLRNTGPSGVPTEILEYLYENLTFTQFIYVEDRDDLQRRASEAAVAVGGLGASGGGGGSGLGGPSLHAAGGSAGQTARARIDPYYLITQGKLGELRADIDHLIPEDTPFSYTGTLAGFDIDRLNAAFLHAPSIEIATGRPAVAAVATPPVSSWVGLEVTAHMGILQQASQQQPDEVVSLKVTKVGVVSRKDDVGDGGRKTASRKWKTCGLLLTGSQLLLFKDIVWTTALQSQILDQVGHSQLSDGIGPPGPEELEPVEGGVIISPRITYFRPDGVISLADAVAVKDNTYTKYDFVFRLLAAKGRQYLIQAQNEDDMNDWIHKINFCACFRTCDLKIRGLDLSSRPSSALGGGAASAAAAPRGDGRSSQGRRSSAASDARTFASEGMKLSHSSTYSSMSDVEGQAATDVVRPTSSAGIATAARSMSPTLLADDDSDEDREELDEAGEANRSFSPTSCSRVSSRASSSRPMPLLQKRLAARRELVLAKIEETAVSLKKVTDVLDEELRLARHFAVLTPFQKVTRDRIEAAALPLSRKIKQLRLELAREESRVKVLELDLAAGERVARSAVPSLRLSTSFVNEARKMPGSQLAMPQLLELNGMSESQAGFEETFGSPPATASHGSASRSLDVDATSPIEAGGRARLAQSQRRPSSEIHAAAKSVQQQQQQAPSSSALASGRITRPAHQQRHQTNLNSVSEQSADESPVLGNGHLDNSFRSSRPSDSDLTSADVTEADDAEEEDEGEEGAGRTASDLLEVRGSGAQAEGQPVSPARSSISRSSASFEGRPDGSNDSLPREADDDVVPEEWDMSRLARDGGNRISLVDLPSPGELKEATTRRFIFGVSESSTVG